MANAQLLHCYNKGCGMKFDPDENADDSCTYHPGEPNFHDAYKIWTCCQKKSTDFATWLNFEGCRKGKHNNNKTTKVDMNPIVEDIKFENLKVVPTCEEIIVWNGLNKPAERQKNVDSSFENLKFVLNENYIKVLEKQRKDVACGETDQEGFVGCPCRNVGCGKINDGTNDKTPCVYHPGTAIFHEGMKYWSCCQKRTTDFNSFLEQAGCKSGSHSWSKIERSVNVREDWFCRTGEIHLNIYCKGTLPELSSIRCDGLTLQANIVHSFGTKQCQRDIELFGNVDVENSRVLIGERKLEIVLKQVKCESWPRLTFE